MQYILYIYIHIEKFLIHNAFHIIMMLIAKSLLLGYRQCQIKKLTVIVWNSNVEYIFHLIYISTTPATKNDLNVFRDSWNDLHDRILVADKRYQNADNESFILNKYNSYLLSPVKYPRGVEQETKQKNRAADDLYNRSASSIRQPIESLFNWLIERTNIQRASKVRSAAGLISFIFWELAAVFLLFKFFKP